MPRPITSDLQALALLKLSISPRITLVKRSLVDLIRFAKCSVMSFADACQVAISKVLDGLLVIFAAPPCHFTHIFSISSPMFLSVKHVPYSVAEGLYKQDTKS